MWGLKSSATKVRTPKDRARAPKSRLRARAQHSQRSAGTRCGAEHGGHRRTAQTKLNYVDYIVRRNIVPVHSKRCTSGDHQMQKSRVSTANPADPQTASNVVHQKRRKQLLYHAHPDRRCVYARQEPRHRAEHGGHQRRAGLAGQAPRTGFDAQRLQGSGGRPVLAVKALTSAEGFGSNVALFLPFEVFR